ncbi:MAG TPA: hypothetical protein VHX88_20315 [Solirubrobacteraceae bacterium]|jgi:hypothetical protein|nr:hypothetical protein [Solirubrobacteraceae bacterium]
MLGRADPTGEQLTVSFADPTTAAYGMARIRVRTARDGTRAASAMVFVLADGQWRERRCTPFTAVSEASDWPAVDDLQIDTDGDLVTVRAGGAAPIELRFEPAFGPPVAVGGAEEISGRVHGTVAGLAVDGVGQVGRRPLPGRTPAIWRELDAWPTADSAVIARAVAQRRAPHGHEELSVAIVEGEPPTAEPISDPRLSTVYDGEHAPLRVGLELWENEEAEHPRRLAGETLGQLAVDDEGGQVRLAFVRVHMEGHEGVGRYEIAHAG